MTDFPLYRYKSIIYCEDTKTQCLRGVFDSPSVLYAYVYPMVNSSVTLPSSLSSGPFLYTVITRVYIQKKKTHFNAWQVRLILTFLFCARSLACVCVCVFKCGEMHFQGNRQVDAIIKRRRLVPSTHDFNVFIL